MICPGGECWTVVEDGNKYQHVHTNTVSFEHQTSLQFSDDSSEDDDGEDAVYEPEDENEQHDQHPCCGKECHARGLPCTAAILREMGRHWLENESEPIAPPESPCNAPEDQKSSCNAPEDLVPAPTPACGSASEIGGCSSICSLANRLRGRFRRAHRTESPGSGQMIEMESPDGPQDRNKVLELEDECEGDVDENYRAISEILRNLEGKDKAENETSEAPKQDLASCEYASGTTKTRRRNIRRKAMARATQTVRVRKMEKAVQTEATATKPDVKAEEPAEELQKNAIPTCLAALNFTLMRCLPKRRAEPDANMEVLDGSDPETDEEERCVSSRASSSSEDDERRAAVEPDFTDEEFADENELKHDQYKEVFEKTTGMRYVDYEVKRGIDYNNFLH